MSIARVMSWVPTWVWILLTIALWAVSAYIWYARLDAMADNPIGLFLLDWHVYAAGGRDLVERDLYSTLLRSAYHIPLDQFNYPPLAAALALPFLLVPDSVGGPLFVLVNGAAVGGTAVLLAHVIRLPHPWLWGGALFAYYSWNLFGGWSRTAVVGNNTPLILLFVASFIAAQLANRSVAAGALLGIAIATKVWPATLLVPLARERRWRTIAWAVGVAATTTAVLLLWLGGPTVIAPMLRALAVRDNLGPDNVVVGITWLRERTDWWPDWGGYAVCALMLLIPAKGLTGYGLAIGAGMAAIPNLWRHYYGTIFFAIVITIRGVIDRGKAPSGSDDVNSSADRSTDAPAGGDTRLGDLDRPADVSS